MKRIRGELGAERPKRPEPRIMCDICGELDNGRHRFIGCRHPKIAAALFAFCFGFCLLIPFLVKIFT